MNSILDTTIDDIIILGAPTKRRSPSTSIHQTSHPGPVLKVMSGGFGPERLISTDRDELVELGRPGPFKLFVFV